MRRVLPLLTALLFLATADAAAASTTGRLLVSLRPSHGAVAAGARAVVARAGARVAGPAVPQIGLLVVRPRPGERLSALAARLRADPRVRAVSAEGRFALREQPDDPALTLPETATGTAPGTTVEWWPAREGFFHAWDLERGAGALVGVIDTGIDGTHPEFAGKVARANDLDASGSATTDTAGHGTHVASLACAATGNGVGIAGAGHDCSLIVEKSNLSDSSVARGLVDATDAGALAISMSFGTDGRAQAPPAIVDALRYAHDHGVVLVAAAADDAVSEQGDPANVLQPTGTGPDLGSGLGLSVTAATAADRRASYAGYGTQISLAAYGTYAERTGPRGLLGAWPANTTTGDTGLPGVSPPCGCRTTFQGDPRYAYVQGTSMATPQVAAAAALMRRLNPDLPVDAVVRLLKQTASRPAGTGWSSDLGWGILDAGAAVGAAAASDATPPTSSLLAPPRTHRRTVLLRVHYADPGPPGVVHSGVRKVRILRSVDGGPARRVAITLHHTLRVRVRPGHVYTFSSQAVDRAGNVQVAAAAPARTRALR